MAKIKKIIIFLSIIAIFIISLIILLVSNSNKKSSEIKTGNEKIKEESNNNKEIQLVLDNSEFYTIENCVKKYEAYVNLNYEEQVTELNMPSLAATYKITNQDEKDEAILNLLDKEYCDKNNINKSNINKNIEETTNEEIVVSANKINKLISESKNVAIYAVYSIKENNKNKQEQYYVVKIDDTNECFSIIPLDNTKYGSLEEINIKNTTESIEKNTRNKVIKSNINDSQIANKYFKEFKTALLSDSDKAYNMLNEEYRNSRFGNLDTFKKYISDNLKDMQQLQVLQYSKVSYENYNEYAVQDAHNNIIIFDEKSPNQYDVKLDTYIIPTEKFKETYDKSDDEYRCQMNIDKFFQMINRKDYKTSYKCLADSYKNNYFKTETDFANFVKSNFYEYNKMTFKKAEQKGNRLYSFEVELTDLTGNNSETKKVNVIMQLNDNYDFVMSFSM